MLTESERTDWNELIELNAEGWAMLTSFEILGGSVVARRNWATAVLLCLAVLFLALCTLLFNLRWLPYHTWEPLFSATLVVGFGLAGIAHARSQLSACAGQVRTAQRDLQPDLNDARNLIAEYADHVETRPVERRAAARQTERQDRSFNR